MSFAENYAFTNVALTILDFACPATLSLKLVLIPDFTGGEFSLD
jgi:hypothetical protein